MNIIWTLEDILDCPLFQPCSDRQDVDVHRSVPVFVGGLIYPEIIRDLLNLMYRLTYQKRKDEHIKSEYIYTYHTYSWSRLGDTILTFNDHQHQRCEHTGWMNPTLGIYVAMEYTEKRKRGNIETGRSWNAVSNYKGKQMLARWNDATTDTHLFTFPSPDYLMLDAAHFRYVACILNFILLYLRHFTEAITDWLNELIDDWWTNQLFSNILKRWKDAFDFI